VALRLVSNINQNLNHTAVASAQIQILLREITSIVLSLLHHKRNFKHLVWQATDATEDFYLPGYHAV
jgi:hypothetical protein